MIYEIYTSDYESFKTLCTWNLAQGKIYHLNADQEMYVVKIERVYSEETLRELLVDKGIEFDIIIPVRLF